MTHPTHVTIHNLKLDEKVNVRKTDTGAEAAFLANIEQKGILVPLTVRPNGSGYLVINGGKRLAALQHLAKTGKKIEGKPADAYLVPIHVRDEDDASARDTSLASNIIVAPMHPVDRYEAFVKMIEDGATETKLQTDFAMTAKEVKQVLALGALSPKVLDAWKAGKIDAEVAQAFTLATSHKLQDKALSHVLMNRTDEDLIDEPVTADDVKDRLDVTPADIGGMVDFVGIEEYESKGGKVTPDLFGTDHKVSNEKLAKEMAAEKLNSICAGLVQAGWGWALVESTVRNTYNYSRMRASEVKPTEAEQAQLLDLKSKGESD
jgi:ParB family chromosome partitioning protein